MKRDFTIFLKKKTARVLTSSSSSSASAAATADGNSMDVIEEREEQGFSVFDLTTKPFAIRIICMENFSHSLLSSVVADEQMEMSKITNKIGFFIEVGLYYGGKLIGQLSRTNTKLTPHWAQVINLGSNYANLPAVRLVIVFARVEPGTNSRAWL